MIIKYKIKKNRLSKRIKLTIQNDGRVVITTPYFVNKKVALQFLHEKKNWVIEKIKKIEENKHPILEKTRDDFLRDKEKARTIIIEKIQYFNNFYNFKYKKIAIRDQRTRWGSCSSAGNLNFNYKILYLPDEISNYIIVHELCHLKEHNHSKNFWHLVAETIPDYKNIRKNLKNYNF